MALREILAKFGIQVDTKKLLGFDKSISGAVDRLQQLGTVIGGSVVVGGLRSFVSEMLNVGDEVGKAAGRLGLSTDELQGWRHALGLAGVSAEHFETAVRALNVKAFDAGIKKSAEAQLSFKKIGVSVLDQDKKLKGFSDLWLDVAEGLSRVTNETERSALAQQLLGEGGTRIAPFFLQGRDAMMAARGELEKFGGGLSKETVKALEAGTDAVARFDLAWLSFKGRIISQYLPSFVKTTEAISEFVSRVGEALAGTDILQASLVAAAVAAATFGKSILLAFVKALPMIGLVVLAVLLLEDTIGTLKGKDSVIKDLFDAFAGAGSTEKQVNRLSKAMDALLDKDYSGAGNETLDFFASFGEDIVQHLVTPIIIGLNKIEIAFKQKFHDITQSVVIWAMELPDKMSAQLNSYGWGGLMEDIASEMVEGFLIPFKGSGAKKMAEAVVGAVKGAITGANNEAGVKSPSTKMARFGSFLAQGATMGWKRKAPDFERAVLSSMSRTINVVGAQVRQTNQISQSITGVSDPRVAGDRAGSKITGSARDGFDSALAALVAIV
jgi:hypothetical protein